MVSIIIPSRNEIFLAKTIESLLEKAKGEIEIIAILDGYWPNPPLNLDKRLKILHRGDSKGLRAAVNSGVAMSKGDYILKTDAHCLFDEGFDVKLVADCEDNWIVIPRRKRLDAENWSIQDVGKPDIDYEYLSYPEDNTGDFGGKSLHGRVWKEKNSDLSLRDKLIDDKMSAQGSCYFMKKTYFYELELMDEEHYGMFYNEAQEFGLKSWLSGGRMIVNKKTWYAHLHKGKKYGRGYHLPNSALDAGALHTLKWMNFKEAWDKQTKPLSWMIEHFSPVPEWTPERIQALKDNGN